MSKSEIPVYFDILGDFCFCQFYAKECLSEKGTAPMCKHVLATKMAEALNLCDVKNIEDNDFAPLLLSSKMH